MLFKNILHKNPLLYVLNMQAACQGSLFNAVNVPSAPLTQDKKH